MPEPIEAPQRVVYWRVGMFFEKVIEIDEPLSQNEVTNWAYKKANDIAERDEMVVTTVEVIANDDAFS